jgi:hypothetical protein
MYKERKTIVKYSALFLAVLGLMCAFTCFSVAVPVELPVYIIEGGDGANWMRIGNNGYTIGFGVFDASIEDQYDAFDDGMTIWVNDEQYVSPSMEDGLALVDLTGTTVTSGPVPLSGLDVVMQYFADPASPTMRTFVSFTNPAASAISANVSLQTNLGSDGNTQVLGSSSGDTTYAADDRWLITDDYPGNGDPTVTHVLYGTGNPIVTPSSVSLTVFEANSTAGLSADYDITVPGYSTLSLLFFNQIHLDDTEAFNDVTVFDSNAALGNSGLLTGLSDSNLANIENWDFAVVSEPSTILLLTTGLIGMIAYDFRRRKL